MTETSVVTTEPAGPRHLWRDAALVFFVFLLLCLGTLSRNIAAAHDTISYINVIDGTYVDPLDEAQVYYHPHHLLYAPTARCWLRLWQALGVRADSRVVVGAMSALFGALCLVVFFLMMRLRLGASRAAAAGVTALAGLSFGIWFYSACVEVYIPALLFVALTMLLLTRPVLRPVDVLCGGLATGLAIAYHQMHGLLAISVAVWWLLYGRRTVRFRLMALYAAAAIVAAVVPYLIAIQLQHLHGAELIHYLTLYAHKPHPLYPLNLRTPLRMAIGAGHCLLGGHFLFALPQADQWLERFLHDNYLVDELFLARGMPAWVAVSLTGLAGVIVATIVGALAATAGGARRFTDEARGLTRLSVILIVIYSVLAMIHLPSHLELYIGQLYCFWLIFGALLLTRPRLAKLTLCVLPLLLLTVNYFGSMQRLADPQRDYYQVLCQDLKPVVHPGDLVIVDRWWIYQGSIRRYVGCDVMSLTQALEETSDVEKYLALVRSRIDARLAAGHDIIVFPDAMEPTPQKLVLFDKRAIAITRLWPEYRDRTSALKSGEFIFYRISGKATGAGP